jgi:hypothetical protein
MRDSLHQLLERETARQQLQAWGVDPKRIESRIDNLTNAELAHFNKQINDPQAGGDVLAILLTIFLVFVITDAIGATDVFPFINPIN